MNREAVIEDTEDKRMRSQDAEKLQMADAVAPLMESNEIAQHPSSNVTTL